MFAWAAQQWGSVDLGDARLNRRAAEIGGHMAAIPGASLPEQMGTMARLKTAYRLLHGKKVSHVALSQPHWEATRQRAAEEPLVLHVMDVMYLDLSRYADTMSGLGEFDSEGRGLLLHSTLSVVPQPRHVLGLAHQQVYKRIRVPEGESRKDRPKEERESRVWAEAAHAMGPAPSGSRQVIVADREADHGDFVVACTDLGYDFTIRLAYNRRLANTPDDAPGYLMDTARGWEAVCGIYVDVPATKKAPARRARVLVSYGKEAFRRLDGRDPVPLWVVHAWEVDAPEGVEPLEWFIGTSVPVKSVADALERLDWYACRWIIEDYHQCLKTGCAVEKRDFSEAIRIERLLGFLALVALRLLQLRDTARLNPDLPATAVADDLTIRVLAAKSQGAAEEMTVRAFWRNVAKLGGFLGRRRDGDPGWKTLWRGWFKLEALVEGVRLAHVISPN